jgi:hypothetical protein
MGVAARAAVERMTLNNMAIELDALYEQLLAR